jgi:excisionase family DNA binding protein
MLRSCVVPEGSQVRWHCMSCDEVGAEYTKSTTCYPKVVNGDASLLNVRETAARLGVHENTVRNWARQGVLRDARVPGSRFHKFREEDVQRLLAQRGEVTPSLQIPSPGPGLEFMTASHLAAWPVDRARDAQERFPELLRRLLVATPGVTNVSMRAGDGVGETGVDGSALSTGSAYLPVGKLVFELGVGKDPGRKADEDYGSRAKVADPSTTFVFTTPRRWSGGLDWAKARAAEGAFADVKVLDADDLEGWLQATPSVHLWISEHLGFTPREAQTLETWWSRFSAAAMPALPSELFVAGRTQQASQLIEKLHDQPQVIAVQSEWSEDCKAFTCSVLSADKAGLDEVPVVLVDSARVWERILDQPGRAVLIPTFEAADVANAVERGHHVVVLVDRAAVSREPAIVLPRIDRRAAAEAFQAAGLDHAKADELAVLGRRSLPALARKLSRNPRLSRPGWALAPMNQILAPLALVGSWTSAEDDRTALEELVGRPIADIESVVRQVADTSDPVMRRVGTHWSLTSPEEAFLLLRDSVTEEAITRWSDRALALLLEPDPVLELPPNERHLAGIRGVRRPHSHTLRKGVAEGLALLGVMGDATRLPDGSRLAERAQAVVRNSLAVALGDASGRTLRLVAGSLPLMAEAAPDDFLRALAEDLARPSPVLLMMFPAEGTEPSPLFRDSSPHPYLLWAIETLCWSPEHLLDGVRLLTRLAAAIPKSRHGNHPMNSLSSILCGWVRNTSATLPQRIAALDAAMETDAVVGWNLLFELWPTGHGFVSPPSAPAFRDWRPTDSTVLMTEWGHFVHALVDRAIGAAGCDAHRLCRLAEGISTVPADDQNRILEMLDAYAQDAAVAGPPLPLWECLSTLTAKHERFQHAAWAMPGPLVARLKIIAASLEPASDPLRFSRLFGWHSDLIDHDRSDYDGYRRRLAEMRREAIDTLDQEGELGAAFVTLAQRVKAPAVLGWAFAEHAKLALDDLLPHLDAPTPEVIQAFGNWASRSQVVQGAAWLSLVLSRQDLPAELRRVVVRSAPVSRESWDVLRAHPKDFAEYWETASVEYIPLPLVGEAVEQLLIQGRAWAALATVASAIDPSDSKALENEPATSLVTTVLDAAIEHEPSASEITQTTGYYVAVLLDLLVRRGLPTELLVRYEFAFYPLLDNHREPEALNQALAQDAALFVDLAKRVYRGDGERKREPSDADRNLAEHAWWVLREWNGYPGRLPDGSLDSQVMTNWVRSARLDFSDSKRTDIGDELIGQALAHSPADDDGTWPCEAVRELIESVGSRTLENGLSIGRFNMRGVTTRGLFDGGTQEHALAAEYRLWSKRTQVRWPRTTRVLRELAESYDREAQLEDLKAELTGDGR